MREHLRPIQANVASARYGTLADVPALRRALHQALHRALQRTHDRLCVQELLKQQSPSFQLMEDFNLKNTASLRCEAFVLKVSHPRHSPCLVKELEYFASVLERDLGKSARIVAVTICWGKVTGQGTQGDAYFMVGERSNAVKALQKVSKPPHDIVLRLRRRAQPVCPPITV